MKERQDSLQLAKSQEFDLVVIGGGIAGAGIAQNAALRGLTVLLLEKADFASGFSGCGTQLVSGDLPYMEQLKFNISRSQIEERDRLKRLAPHLVKDISFVLPLLRNNTMFNLKAAVGSKLQDVLNMSGGQNNSQTYINKKKLSGYVPAFSDENLTGAIQFQDAITDDARLIISVIKSALLHGAIALNYVQASGFRTEAGKITHVNCRDRYSGEEFSVACKACVNATGVATDEVVRSLEASALAPVSAQTQASSPDSSASQASSASQTPSQTPSQSPSQSGDQPKTQLVNAIKSTRLIIPASSFETNTALLLPAKGGRFVFIIPWHHALLIGSAEGEFKADKDSLYATSEEIAFLLDSVNAYVTPAQRLSTKDVIATISGLKAQVVPTAETNSAVGKADYTIYESADALVSVVGARLTNYRMIAEEIMERLSNKHSWLDRGRANTELAMLGGWNNKDEYPTKSAEIEIKARKLSIDPASIQHLISNYGAEAEHVVDLVEKQPALNQRIIPDFPVIMAEVPFTVIGEMTVSLQDFMLRRTRLGLLNHKQAIAAASRVAEAMAKILDWDSYRSKIEVSAFEQEIIERKEEAGAVG